MFPLEEAFHHEFLRFTLRSFRFSETKTILRNPATAGSLSQSFAFIAVILDSFYARPACNICNRSIALSASHDDVSFRLKLSDESFKINGTAAIAAAHKLIGGSHHCHSYGAIQPSIPNAIRCTRTKLKLTYPIRWLRFHRTPPIAWAIMGNVVIAGNANAQNAIMPANTAISP